MLLFTATYVFNVCTMLYINSDMSQSGCMEGAFMRVEYTLNLYFSRQRDS